jgi:beta-fructofuranosidase
MGLRLDDHWIWDFWLARDGHDHHLFFLQAPRSLGDPEQRHWHVSIGHAVSRDLRQWTLLPDALAPAGAGAWDDYTTWTGSVLRHGGRWFMFYTGTSRREHGKVQRVGLAISDDLVGWRRHGTGPLIESDPRWYEQLDPRAWPELAWRDPWVFQDPATGRFHAMVTARARAGDPATRGVIGHAISDDLLNWTVRAPVTEPGVFGHLEIPQVERVGGAWRLLFCTPPAPPRVRADRPAFGLDGTHALTAAHPLGPYDWSTHQPLDADPAGSRYGGRLVRVGTGWQLLAWLHRGPAGGFVGELADPVPVRAGPDGTGLRLAPVSGAAG